MAIQSITTDRWQSIAGHCARTGNHEPASQLSYSVCRYLPGSGSRDIQYDVDDISPGAILPGRRMLSALEALTIFNMSMEIGCIGGVAQMSCSINMTYRATGLLTALYNQGLSLVPGLQTSGLLIPGNYVALTRSTILHNHSQWVPTRISGFLTQTEI